VNEPEEAAAHYLDYAKSGSGKVELQAMTNAAVLLESLGEREKAASVYFSLADALKGGKDTAAEAGKAYQAGCNNVLLSSYQNKDDSTLRKILACSNQLSRSDPDAILWQARAAWALDQSADNLQAQERWKKLAAKSVKATPEADRAYLAMAKLKVLQQDLEKFHSLRFSQTNERPEANISKKTAAMDQIEKLAGNVIKIGTPKQILTAKDIIRQAYLDFADTMENAALPSKLSEKEGQDLKKTFLTFAQQFKDKAAGLAAESAGAAGSAGRSPATVGAEPAANGFKLASLSSDDNSLLENGTVPQGRAAELFAKKAYSLYQDGKFGEAKYFAEKWGKEAGAVAAGQPYGQSDLEKFQSLLSDKLPDTDPVSKDF
jgi:hypothetical protein